MVITAIPDLVILEETREGFFLNSDGDKISGLLIGEWDKIFIPKKEQRLMKRDDEKQWEGDSVEANPPAFMAVISLCRESVPRVRRVASKTA